MDYPDIDRALIVAANEKHETVNAASQNTQAAILAAESALVAAQQARKNLVAQAARGETVHAAQHREAEESVRETERQVFHLREVLEIQEQSRLAADEDRMKSHKLAHRPRIVHAMRELADCGEKNEEAQAILAGVSRSDGAARKALEEAWAAGYPAPAGLTQGLAYGMRPIPSAATEKALRTLFGNNLADEAFGPAETPAAPAA